MSLYAIGDLHLSLTTNKPMDVFGPRWKNYVEKIRRGFSVLTDDDICVICGDISWGMNLDESLEDFRFIESLPGRKMKLTSLCPGAASGPCRSKLRSSHAFPPSCMPSSWPAQRSWERITSL